MAIFFPKGPLCGRAGPPVPALRPAHPGLTETEPEVDLVPGTILLLLLVFLLAVIVSR